MKTSRQVQASLCAVHASVGCRDYATVPLTVDEVRRLLVAAGGVPAVLNTAHAFAKAKRWECDPPTVETFVADAAADADLLRRPIWLAGRQTVVGDQVQAMLVLIAG